MPKLALKRQRFVDEYLVDLNATQAAIRAGYSSKTARAQGQRMLTNVDIQQALTEVSQERILRTQIDQDWVIAKLVENVDRALTARPVLDRKGVVVGEYVYDGGVANTSLKLLGDHLRMFPAPGAAVNMDNRVVHFIIGKGYSDDPPAGP